MKNHIIYSALAAGCALALSACSENEWNDKLDGFEVPDPYTKVETVNYTLTPADYKTIAADKANKALATTDDEAAALAAIGTNGCFATAEEARKYIPALLASSSFPYFSMNEGSSVKVEYILTSAQDPEVLAINAGVNSVTVTKADYQKIWGSNQDFIQAFAPAHPATPQLPKLIAASVTDAAEGDYAVIGYDEAAENPDFNAITYYINEPFASSIGGFTMENILLPEGSTYVWSFDTRGYAKASAYVGGKNCDAEAWLVSPEIELSADANATFTYDQAWNFFSDIAAAKAENAVGVRIVGEQNWQTLSVPAVPSSLSWTFVNSGEIDLSAYNGKKIQIGFYYKGNATKCGTTEIKNVKVFSGAIIETTPQVAVYRYNGSDWVFPGSTSILQSSDYIAMGQGSNMNLSGTLPQEILPAYLRLHIPYPQNEQAQTVVYRYYDSASKTTSFRAMQLTYTDGEWAANLGDKVDQFSKKGGSWVYNPSVVITLPYARSTEPSYTYYVGCVKWVYENITKQGYGISWETAVADGGGFIRKGGEAEFYSGASGFYGNVDVRAITAKNNAPEGYTGYDGLTDDEISMLVKKRFCLETMRGSLESLHADAEPVAGMDITYTINFTSYGTETTEETLVYKIASKGKFSYVSCTWFTEGEDAGWQ